MPSQPSIVECGAQPYLAIRRPVTMRTIAEIADRIPEVLGWLAMHGVTSAGAPFLKYNLIDMERQLEVEAGVPVAGLVDGEGPVRFGVLPAGRYATVTHIGHPNGLIEVTAALLAWAAERGLRWDMSESSAGQRWGCRLEVFKTNPAEQPDPSKWETELLFRLAD
jgi:effector-binding domain-containing protein